MRLFRLGASWGGVHSLVAATDPKRSRTGLEWVEPGPVWRLSIGLEATKDLQDDLARALEIFADGTLVTTKAPESPAE